MSTSILASPFAVFDLLPCYGHNEAVITWALQPGITGSVYFYRSETGVGGWKLLNPTAGASGSSGSFTDSTAVNIDPFTIPRYRGMVDGGGAPSTWLKGPAISALDRLTRKEYFLTCNIIRREYRGMSGPKGNGIRAFHLVPKESGDPTRTYNPETGQILGPDCPDDAATGHGTPWQGGFYPPLQTWVHLFQVPATRLEDRQDLTGENRISAAHMRLLAFPKPEPGHLIVLPESDRRYAITSPIEVFMLRGSVPLFWEVEALLLERHDARAKIRMPALNADPLWQPEYRRD